MVKTTDPEIKKIVSSNIPIKLLSPTRKPIPIHLCLINLKSYFGTILIAKSTRVNSMIDASFICPRKKEELLNARTKDMKNWVLCLKVSKKLSNKIKNLKKEHKKVKQKNAMIFPSKVFWLCVRSCMNSTTKVKTSCNFCVFLVRLTNFRIGILKMQ